MHKEEIAYHRARAADELNRGLTCSSVPAARSHLKLSSLHFERLRELEGQNPSTERPLFVM